MNQMESMNASDEAVAFINSLLQVELPDGARHLLQERSVSVNAEVVEILISLADRFLDKGEWEIAIWLAELAVDAASILGKDELRADSLFTMAMIYQQTSHLEEARELYQQAASLYEGLGIESQLANCLAGCRKSTL